MRKTPPTEEKRREQDLRRALADGAILASYDDPREPKVRSLDFTKPEGHPQALQTYITRANIPRPYECLPGLYAHREDYQRFIYDAVSALKQELPGSEPGVDGFYRKDQFPGEYDRALCVMGVPHDPEFVPPYDSSEFKRIRAKDTGRIYRFDLNESETRLADRLAKVIFARAMPKALSIKKKSSSGAPLSTRSLLLKKRLVDEWLVNGSKIWAKLRAGQYMDLAIDHGIVFLFLVGRRYQNELPSKRRYGRDWLGKWLIANKKLPTTAANYRDAFVCCRSRKINAGFLAGDAPLRFIQAELFAHQQREFPLLSPSDPNITAALMGNWKYMKMYDVDNHDVFMPPGLLYALIRRLRQLYGDDFALLAEHVARAPQLLKNDYRGGRGVRIEGNPFTKQGFKALYVNSTGWPLTSALARFAGLFYCFNNAMRIHGELVDELFIERTLRGENPLLFFLNMGDNIVILSSEERHVDLQSDLADFSTTTTFGGKTFGKDDRGQVHWSWNLDGYFLNLVVNGRDLGDPMRGNAAEGYFLRKSLDLYGSHSKFPVMDAILNGTFASHFGSTLDRWMSRQPMSVRSSESYYSGPAPKSLLDKKFVEDPDIVQWLIDPRLVSPDLLEHYYLTYEPRQVADALQRLIDA